VLPINEIEVGSWVFILAALTLTLRFAAALTASLTSVPVLPSFNTFLFAFALTDILRSYGANGSPYVCLVHFPWRLCGPGLHVFFATLTVKAGFLLACEVPEVLAIVFLDGGALERLGSIAGLEAIRVDKGSDDNWQTWESTLTRRVTVTRVLHRNPNVTYNVIGQQSNQCDVRYIMFWIRISSRTFDVIYL
jgi:hypothetical protein